jgi:plasmid stability protein
MPSLTIRNISEDLMARLREASKGEKRSVNAQALHWLDSGARRWVGPEERAKLLTEIHSLRDRVYARHGVGSDSAVLTRRARMQRSKSQ